MRVALPKETSELTIAISLSGGGARAMAFHLGCLRALHTAGLLERADVLSCVSGGSVIGAIYVTHDGVRQEKLAKDRRCKSSTE